MCIFTGGIRSVSNTRILLVPLNDGRQMTVYQNDVETSGSDGIGRAMILPVPSSPKGEPIHFVDMSKFRGNIFDRCDMFFPERNYEAASMGFGGGFGSHEQKSAPLPVQRVGGYNCSVVPTIGDFGRLSDAHFKIPTNVAQVLSANYSQGFSFVVCVFDRNIKAHPIAYISSRFHDGKLFIPTRHAHGEELANGNGRKQEKQYDTLKSLCVSHSSNSFFFRGCSHWSQL